MYTIKETNFLEKILRNELEESNNYFIDCISKNSDSLNYFLVLQKLYTIICFYHDLKQPEKNDNTIQTLLMNCNLTDWKQNYNYIE